MWPPRRTFIFERLIIWTMHHEIHSANRIKLIPQWPHKFQHTIEKLLSAYLQYIQLNCMTGLCMASYVNTNHSFYDFFVLTKVADLLWSCGILLQSNWTLRKYHFSRKIIANSLAWCSFLKIFPLTNMVTIILIYVCNKIMMEKCNERRDDIREGKNS